MIWQKFENPWLDTTALRLNVELDHTIRAHKTEDMTTCTGRSAHSKYMWSYPQFCVLLWYDLILHLTLEP